jgi:hypothetical protein
MQLLDGVARFSICEVSRIPRADADEIADRCA